MELAKVAEILGTALAGALENKGFKSLTPVQAAVLDEKLRGRDLRMSSQTGSGKTVALGFAVRDLVVPDPSVPAIGPRVLVIVPTRELAKQVREELGWLFAPLGAKVAAVSGGANYREEQRALASGPTVVVGTPGRLLDQLLRGAFDSSHIAALVLDEADRMLDMGFRDELEAILAELPKDRRTHLVSATFPRQVEALADRVQRDAVRIEGTPLGTANVDIEHVIHLVDPAQRVDALVNLLLAHPEDQVLVFARTRADVADITEELSKAGFRVSSLSGELEQRDRERALSAFKRGRLDALVATDVAARGIDVSDIGRVIHIEPPDDVDSYTHRSGRTGRAGRKGTSSVLTTPGELWKTTRLLARAKVKPRFEAIPSAESIQQAEDERLFRELVLDDEAVRGSAAGHTSTDGTDAPPRSVTESEAPPLQSARGQRFARLAERLSQSPNVKTVIARLLSKVGAGQGRHPREILHMAAPTVASETSRRASPNGRSARASAVQNLSRQQQRGNPRLLAGERRMTTMATAPADRSEHVSGPATSHRTHEWVPFLVTWGELHGADARRLLALVCRRGDIRGDEVGAIRVGRTQSIVEIDSGVAGTFANAVAAPDPRDPRVQIRPDFAPQNVRSSRVRGAREAHSPSNGVGLSDRDHEKTTRRRDPKQGAFSPASRSRPHRARGR